MNVKSKSLIHSHLGLEKSSILKKSKIDKSFGKNTDFDFCEKNLAYIVGANHQSDNYSSSFRV